MPSNVFYPHLNDLCRKYLIGGQPLTPVEIADFEPARRKVEGEIFENLAIFDRIDFKVFGENVPLAVLVRLFGVDGLERLMDQDALGFTLWTPVIAHLVDPIEGIDPLVFGRQNSTVHCDPEESIAKGLEVLDPALKPGENRMIRRKVRDLYSLPDNRIAEDAVKLTKSAFSSGKLTAYGLDPKLKEYQRLWDFRPRRTDDLRDRVGRVHALDLERHDVALTGQVLRLLFSESEALGSRRCPSRRPLVGATP